MLLIFGRHPTQSIMIDHDIRVTIVDNKYGTVWVKVEAPEHTKIRRGELVPFRHKYEGRKLCNQG